jgi:cysteinyl-tRNA synthetase
MSRKYLGEEIDIHAGGEDLIFPHHENEIAQSEAANGKLFAKYWMHNAFLNIDNKKMSKSLGNFFTVRDIAAKYDLQVLRLFMLSAHYRSPLNFSSDLMEAAESSLTRIRRAASRLADLKAAAKTEELLPEESAKAEEIKGFISRFDEKMDDDANTADALSVIFDLVKYANVEVTEESSKALVSLAADTLHELCDIMGLIDLPKQEVLDSDIENLIAERQAARKARNFARADEIRDMLKGMGIELMDTKEGVKWSRK